jgi:hypothetical protein
MIYSITRIGISGGRDYLLLIDVNHVIGVPVVTSVVSFGFSVMISLPSVFSHVRNWREVKTSITSSSAVEWWSYSLFVIIWIIYLSIIFMVRAELILMALNGCFWILHEIIFWLGGTRGWGKKMDVWISYYTGTPHNFPSEVLFFVSLFVSFVLIGYIPFK